MIGYLSGPITGQKNYRQQFARAAGALKELGYIVINPAELGTALPLDHMSYEDIMKIDLELLATADYLVQLPGWERSPGANRSWASPWALTRSSWAWSSFSRRR